MTVSLNHVKGLQFQYEFLERLRVELVLIKLGGFYIVFGLETVRSGNHLHNRGITVDHLQ